MPAERVTVVAPATVGNVGVGFDVLGHALSEPLDRVTLHRIVEREVRITRVDGVVTDLPCDPMLNTAGCAVAELVRACKPDFGFQIEIDKGIPLGSGMGGSGASAVAAVVAANALLPNPLERHGLLEFALAGEAAATGARVLDNVAPALFGGLVLALPGTPILAESIPVPADLRCVLVHPMLQITTRRARDLLAPSCQLSAAVRQAAHLGGLIAGCYAGNMQLVERALDDVLIEPQRSRLVPGFADVKAAARAAGALGCSLSGSGPSLFAWARSADAEEVARAMTRAFAAHEVSSQSFVSPIDAPGAHCVG
ncbi:homoserine kinase [soil metagenome]